MKGTSLTRRRLDQELVRRHLVASRTAAQRAIEAGLVRVGSVTAPKASTLVAPSDPVHLEPEIDRFVGRGGHKLAGALDEFGLEVSGRSALDIGASTGGFTDCLLQRGATSVVALDVGYGQLHWRLRSDPRVHAIERTNVRHVEPTLIGAPFQVVVADLSFISLRIVAPIVAGCGDAATDWLLLVKPQFELGKGRVPAGGVVVDAADRADAVVDVGTSYAALGMHAQRVTPSSVPGAAGNLEFVLWLRRAPAGLDHEELRKAVSA